MKRLLLFLCAAILVIKVQAQPCHEVVAYYPGWKWYDREKLVNPLTIDYSKYTIINYAFFKPLPDGTITNGDSWADKNLLSQNAGSLITEAHKHGVKVIISVGGWTYSKAFPALAATDKGRKKFAAECGRIIRAYNADGIDIDWEYPGYEPHDGSAADKMNFTLLLTEIRNTFTTIKQESGKDPMLTIASGVSRNHLEAIDWQNVKQLVDIINLMTYNYSGPWENSTGHNAPLFKSSETGRKLCVDESVRMLTEDFGVPPGKITLGMAFYARTAITRATASLNGESEGIADKQIFAADNGAPEYYNVLKYSGLYDTRWDWDAKVPYLTGRNGLKSFVSYDDPVSVALKAGYAVFKGLRGAAIWELTGDYVETYPGSGKIASTPLADAISKVFCSPVPLPEQRMTALTQGFLPSFLFSEFMVIDCGVLGDIRGLKVLDSGGRVVAEIQNPVSKEISLDTSDWKTGVYLVRLETPGRVHLSKAVKI